MLVIGPQRGLFLGSLALGIGSLLVLDLYAAPMALAVDAADAAIARLPMPSAAASVTKEAPAAEPVASAVRVIVDPVARVPTIVARFDTESKEPVDEAAIRALALALIQDHEVRCVLEGHSDTRGADDYNQEISLKRAEWVKSRLIELGVSAERVETVGLGATRPLHSDEADAASVNRRVEVRWVGR